MIIRIDARRITDAAALHTVLGEAFGFPKKTGKNLDALVDCLTSLDDPQAGMSRVQLFPGQTALLVLDHYGEVESKGAVEQLKQLADVVAFVNWRRLEDKAQPVLAIAYDH